MTAQLFPLGLFGLANVGPPALARRAMSGGVSLTGLEQKASIDGGGSWTLEASGTLRDPAKIKAWMALEAMLGDGVTPAEVEVPVGVFQPIGRSLVGRPFQWPPSATPSLRQAAATLSAGAALNATQIALAFDAPQALVGGEHFTIAHTTWGPRLYRIQEVVAQDATTATVKFRPWLREAALSAAVVDFDYPRCLMKVVSMSTKLTLGRFAEVSLSLIESRDKAA